MRKEPPLTHPSGGFRLALFPSPFFAGMVPALFGVLLIWGD
jgi:hypothetical protein